MGFPFFICLHNPLIIILEPPQIRTIMVRLRRHHLALLFNWLAGYLCFGGSRCHLRPSFNGRRFGRGDSGDRGHVDLCLGFVDFLREAAEVSGGGREEIDGRDYSDGG